MKKILPAFMLLAATSAMAQKNEDAGKFAATITEKGLKEKLSVIASAEMEGRETATPGQKKAAAYIENWFKKLGLKPGNGTSYQQVYPVYQDELTDKKLSVNGKQFVWDNDYSFGVQSAPATEVSFSNVVFAGYGIIDSAAKVNDYENLDVKGKLVVVLEGMPQGYTPTPITGRRGRFGGPGTAFGKTSAARLKGAAGILLISKSFPHKEPSDLKGNMYLKRTTAPVAFISANISEEVANALVGASVNTAAKGSYTTDFKMSAVKKTNDLESSNVMGLMEGTDKKDEYVILTGHYDHLGKKGNVIYYGADDDGSGTTSVIQMAEAFAEAKKKGKGPRRSILFMTVSGEEKGLWGSEYYAAHPVYPLDKTSVDLNTDMVGRIDPLYKGDSTNYVYVIGDDKLSSDLTPITDSINNAAGKKLELDRRYNDLSDPNQFYYRSDHFNFAKNGVPIIFYFDGVHADYHQPTDTVDKINFDLMEKRVRFIFTTAWVMANRDNMLKRDIPLTLPSRG
ncbi:M28 family peptidase [Chitinophagaceae bacterium LWZ2-11]